MRIVLAIGMVWSLATGLAAAGELKVAVVNMDAVVKAFGEARDAEAVLKKQVENFEVERAELQKTEEALAKAVQDIAAEARDKALSDAAREKKMEGAQEKLTQLRAHQKKMQELTMTRQKQLNEQSSRMRKRIAERLQGIIGKYAEEKGYTLVLDATAVSLSTFETVIYSQKGIDITEEIIRQLPAPAAAPAPAPAAK